MKELKEIKIVKVSVEMQQALLKDKTALKLSDGWRVREVLESDQSHKPAVVLERRP